jgi:signal transduction histidine kinase
VPEPIVSRLFQPFATGRGRDGPRAGTGLGLAIARSTAERHGGSLRWEGRSPELGGALFVLWLPSEPPLPAGA